MKSPTHHINHIEESNVEGNIQQIKILSENSKKSSADNIASIRKLNKSMQLLTLDNNRTPEIVNRILTILSRTQMLSRDSLSTKAKETDIELSNILDKIDILLNEAKEELNSIVETSGNINTNSKNCTLIVEEAIEFTEITELSAQFITHFASAIKGVGDN